MSTTTPVSTTSPAGATTRANGTTATTPVNTTTPPGATTEVGEVTVNYFAAARAAAGAASETVQAGSLAELIADASQRHGAGLAKVLGVCSFLVDGVRQSDPDAELPHGSSVDVLPPFAGG